MSLDPADNVKVPDWVAKLEQWRAVNYTLMPEEVDKLFRELRELYVVVHDLKEDRGLPASPSVIETLDAWCSKNPHHRHYQMTERILELMCFDFREDGGRKRIELRLSCSRGWNAHPPRRDDFFYVGKKNKNATMDETILFALAKWRDLHGDTDIRP